MESGSFKRRTNQQQQKHSSFEHISHMRRALVLHVKSYVLLAISRADLGVTNYVFMWYCTSISTNLLWHKYYCENKDDRTSNK